MAPPVDPRPPEPAQAKAALTALAAALRTLHRALVESSRRDFERDRHAILGAGELLQLLTGDPHFAWLRSLSELIVDLDVFLEADPGPGDDDAAAVRAEVQRLLAPPAAAGAGSEFGARYWPYVHDDPQVAIAHGGVKQGLDDLPRPGDVDEAEVLHDRHGWTEARRHRH
jgi:hypothetical protein